VGNNANSNPEKVTLKAKMPASNDDQEESAPLLLGRDTNKTQTKQGAKGEEEPLSEQSDSGS
jgi:hypothetical protein